MIRFHRVDKTVQIDIEHGIFSPESGQYFPLTITQEYEYQAQLLSDALTKNLNRHLEMIKRKYYDQGWKDAKAKTMKRKWFSGWWEK